MAQEYHNYINVVNADPGTRRRVVRDVLEATPPNWDWVKIEINTRASLGQDSGVTLLDFYSRNFPMGLGELSKRFADTVFDCNLFDLSGEVVRRFKLRNDREWDTSTESIEWEGA
jgi:hypothetical protein